MGQRLMTQRKLKEEKEQKKTGKVAHPKVISRRINLLYGDAERRRADRAWMEEEHEKEQLVGLLKDSVHEHVRQNPAGELERIFEKAAEQKAAEQKTEKDVKASARNRTPRGKHPDADFQMQRSPSEPSQSHCHGHGHGH